MEFLDKLHDLKLGDVSLGSVFSALLVYLICYVAIKILCKAFDKILDASKHLDASLKSFFRSAIKALLWSVAVIIIAGTLGIPVTSLVAMLSVVGVALSLSLQGLLSNLFSGVTLLTTRPFKVGDYVEIGSNGGTVSSIGLFYTGLNTADNRVVYVPNGTVTTGQIVNFSAQDTRRVVVSVTASYDCPTQSVREAALAAAAMDDRVLADPAPFAAIVNYGSSSIEYTVRVWCRTADYWDVYYALLENLRTCFDEHGVEMCYDHLNVHLVSDKPAQEKDEN